MIKILLLISPLLISSFASAQGSTSADDGGQGVLCKRNLREHRGRRYSIETLELYEFRNLYQSSTRPTKVSEDRLTLTWKPHPAVQELKRARKKIERLIGNHPVLHSFDQALEFRIKTTFDKIPYISDTGPVLSRLEKNCVLVQLAVRNESGITLHNDYAQLLRGKDVAAIVLHEALHDYFDDKDSNLVVRQTVGFIFSNRKFQQKNKNLFLELINSRQAVDQRRFQK